MSPALIVSPVIGMTRPYVAVPQPHGAMQDRPDGWDPIASRQLCP